MQNEDVIAFHQMHYVEKPVFRGYCSAFYSTLTRIYRHVENSDKMGLLSTESAAVTKLKY